MDTPALKTKGHEELKERLLTQSELARRCGCSQQAISRILAGGRPKKLLAAKLQKILGIPEDAWLTEQERHDLQKNSGAS